MDTPVIPALQAIGFRAGIKTQSNSRSGGECSRSTRWAPVLSRLETVAARRLGHGARDWEWISQGCARKGKGKGGCPPPWRNVVFSRVPPLWVAGATDLGLLVEQEREVGREPRRGVALGSQCLGLMSEAVSCVATGWGDWLGRYFVCPYPYPRHPLSLRLLRGRGVGGQGCIP